MVSGQKKQPISLFFLEDKDKRHMLSFNLKDLLDSGDTDSKERVDLV